MDRRKTSPVWIPEDRGYDTPCWIWQGALSRGYGYHNHEPAYRTNYVERFGPVPEGLELDHLCRVTACVNPDHLEPVTHRENILRSSAPMAKQAKQTHCIHGHPLSGDNLYTTKQGKRHCKTCTNRRGNEARALLKRQHAGYREALERIAATDAWVGPDGTRASWTHWRTIAQEALDALGG